MPTLATAPYPCQMDVFPAPVGASPSRSVVVAYGTEGMNGRFGILIRDYCQFLAQGGFTVVLPHFLESTQTQPGTRPVVADLTAPNIDHWAKAVVAAIDWCQGNQGNARVGLTGFSLGAYISIQAALLKPVKAIVDFYGPVTSFGEIPFPQGSEITRANAVLLPTLQIHHGTADIIVKPSESRLLKSWRASVPLPCQLFDAYPCGHPGQPDNAWTSQAQTAASKEASDFLKANI